MSVSTEYVDFFGNPISFEQWRDIWFMSHRRVGVHSSDQFFLSTVWLGLKESPYETLLTVGDEEIAVIRHSTLEEARKIHNSLLEVCTHSQLLPCSSCDGNDPDCKVCKGVGIRAEDVDALRAMVDKVVMKSYESGW